MSVIWLVLPYYLQGLNDEYEVEGELLGNYTYQEDGESLQIFPIKVISIWQIGFIVGLEEKDNMSFFFGTHFFVYDNIGLLCCLIPHMK